jgi:choline dehydrogenase-like flavoprotein
MTDSEADVVIIGAGAGGAACAWALCQAGIKVVLLEAGPSYNPVTDYRLDKPDWEKSLFPDKQENHDFYTYGPFQTLEKKYAHLRSVNHITGLYNDTDFRKPFKYHHVAGVGGSTLHFTGEAHRMNPVSMQLHSRFGVGSDWPVSYQQLEPYYLQAENIIGVAGPKDEPSRPRSGPYPLPPHPFSFASQQIASGMSKSGLTVFPNARAALSKPYDGRPACNYCANCNRGCPRTDKGSVDVTFIRKALATGNLDLRPESAVINITPGNNDKVQHIIYQTNAGQHKLNTRCLVIAAGAIQTPRLLLLAENAHAPDGLGNESGQVGKNFMETLTWVSSGVHTKNLGSQRGLPADLISWTYNAPDAIPGIIGGCRFGSGVSEANLVGLNNYASRVVPGWGLQHKQAMRKHYGNVISVSAIGEHISNENSFINLHSREKDTYGLAKAVIHSHLTETDIDRLEFMANKCREVLRASGASAIFEEYGTYDFFSSTHVFGTCRMGLAPEQSVVNAFGRSHRWNNLFITDGSVFPSTGGGESPSLTIEALAIRSAEQIAKLLADKSL